MSAGTTAGTTADTATPAASEMTPAASTQTTSIVNQASAETASTCQHADAASIDKKKGLRPSLKELWATGAALKKALGPIWKRVFLVDLLVTTRVKLADVCMAAYNE